MGSFKDKKIVLKNKQPALIREAREEDAAAYLKLCCDIADEVTTSMVTSQERDVGLEREKRSINQHRDKDGYLNLVAEVEGQLVGQIDFSNGDMERIQHSGGFGMGVHQDYRGLGLGQALLESLIAWAESHSLIEKINLCVHATNTKAIALYEKNGFKVEGERQQDIKYENGRYVNTLLMGRLVNLDG